MPSADAPFHTWLITVGEPLPLPGNEDRLYRTGLLARELVARGGTVTWWTSTFDHVRKRPWPDVSETVQVEPGLRLRFLDGVEYSRNVSVRRLVNHAQLGLQFARAARTEPRPDVIACSYPTIELAYAAARYSSASGVPLVLDVRDLWPDLFWTSAPGPVRPLIKAAVLPYRWLAKRAFSGATAIVGITDAYLRYGLETAGRGGRELDRVFPLAYPDPTALARSDEALARARQRLVECGVSSEKRVFWFLGTFGRSYDMDLLLAASGRLAEQGEESVQVVVSGKGEQESRVASAAERLPNMVYTGWLDSTELAAMGELADAGLACYVAGAAQDLPNKIIEFMALGLPVVTTLGGPTRRYLEERHAGVHSPAGDAEALAATLMELGRDPARLERMGSAAYSSYEREFSAATVYSEYAAYLEAMGHEQGSS